MMRYKGLKKFEVMHERVEKKTSFIIMETNAKTSATKYELNKTAQAIEQVPELIRVLGELISAVEFSGHDIDVSDAQKVLKVATV